MTRLTKTKKIIILIIGFLLTTLNVFSAEAAKLAIIGDTQEDAPLIDLIFSKLLNEPQISLYDRNAIDKILQEHKLQAAGMTSDTVILIRNILHVDYIACISSAENADKKTVPSGIIIFDAKNGYRLLNKTLPADIEKAADFSAEKIKNALNDAMSGKEKKLISILALRNTGVPARYNYQLSQIARRAEELLAENPDISILERAELEHLNKERALSNEIYKLAPSATLLDAEVSQDSTGTKANLTIYVLNSEGKELKIFQFEDILNQNEHIADEIYRSISDYLKILPVVSGDLTNEASRFFEEYKFYKRLRNWNIARQKIESALALNPNKPEYYIGLILSMLEGNIRSKEYIIRKEKYTTQELNTMLDTLLTVIEISDMFNSKFSECKAKSKYNDENFSRYMDYNYDNYMQILIPTLHGNNQAITDEIKNKAAKLCELYRERAFNNERLKLKPDYSIREYETISEYKARSFFYPSREEADKAVHEYMFNVLTECNDFYIANPKNAKYINKTNGEIYKPVLVNNFRNRYNDTIIIQLMKESPLDYIKVAGYFTDFLRKFFNSNKSPEEMECFLNELCSDLNKIETINNILNDKSDRFIPDPSFGSGTLGNKLAQIYYEKFIIFYREHNLFLKEYDIESYLLSLSPNKQILAEKICYLEPEITAILQKKNKAWIRNYRASFNDKTEVERNAINILSKYSNNDPVLEVQKINKNPMTIINSVYYDNKIFIFSKKRSFLEIYELSMAPNKDAQDLLTLKFTINTEKLIPDRFINPIAMDDQYWVIGTLDSIIIISRTDGSMKLIKDLPAENITAITMLNNKIYAFMGNDCTILFSCDMDGNNRQIHISTKRHEKLSHFDDFSPFYTKCLFSDTSKNRLLFIAPNYDPQIYNQGLFEFNTSTNKEKLLLNTGISDASQYGNFINIRTSFAFLVFNMQTDHPDCIIGDKYGKIKDGIGNELPPTIDTKVSGDCFFLKDNYMWTINPLKLSLLPYPNIYNISAANSNYTRYIYPHIDGVSVITVSLNDIMKVIPPPNPFPSNPIPPPHHPVHAIPPRTPVKKQIINKNVSETDKSSDASSKQDTIKKDNPN